MNHAYRLVWNEHDRRFVPAPETARRQGKSTGGKALTFALATVFALPALAAPPAADALPEGGRVSAGQAEIVQSGNRMDITQGSDRAILEWQRFDIGADAQVNFIQPGADSVALNRVLAAEASQIDGQLSANGQVWLINPNGVIFGQGSRVDVGGLVASSLDTLDSDFLAGKTEFQRQGAVGKVVNQGQITAKAGGLVALLAPEVRNEGIISARLGNVVLAAGERIALDAGADGHLKIAVDPAQVDTLVENRHLIRADGGQVVMSAQAAGQFYAAIVANTGTIQARSLEQREGRILLLADMDHGEIRLDGLLDASANTPLPPGGGGAGGEGEGLPTHGGFIETSAAQVRIAATARVTTRADHGHTGTWLIDPNDYTIAASGGDITGAQLSANLADTSIVISTATQGTAGGHGDILVEDSVAWSANTLTLSAERDIHIDAALQGSGTAKLALEYGQGAVAAGNAADYYVAAPVDLPAGANFSTKLGSDGATLAYTVITDVGVAVGVAGDTSTTTLQGMIYDPSGRYALGADIDATDTAGWNGGAGFDTVGVWVFDGTLAGLGHRIDGLTINRPQTDQVGLFGYLVGTVRDLDLTNVMVRGQNVVGALAGNSEQANVSNVHSSGSVIGGAYVGGLIGFNGNSHIRDSHSAGSVIGSGDQVGGLVGYNQGSINASHSTASVNGGATFTGGLVGLNNFGSISDSYSTGFVYSGSGSESTGGLVGLNNVGSVANSYSSGMVVSLGNNVGGLAGSNFDGSVDNSYSTGSVSGSLRVGGLVGINNEGGTIDHGYSTGSVAGSDQFGGLLGYNYGGSIVDSYWNTDTSGQATSAGGTGKTSAELRQLATFAGWDISGNGGENTVWRLYEGSTMPLLRSFLTPITLTPVYDGSERTMVDIAAYSADIANPDTLNIRNDGAGLTLASTATAGSATALLHGYSSRQQGYDISYASRAITGTGSAANDLNIASALTWSKGTLTLHADNDIHIDAAFHGSGTARLALEYGQGAVAADNSADYHVAAPVGLSAGENFSTTLGSDGATLVYTVVTDLGVAGDTGTTSLQGMTNNPSGRYALGADIDAAATANWNGGAGFAPVGGPVGSAGFTGTLAGLGHRIDGLSIDRPGSDAVGLFSTLNGTVRDLGLSNLDIVGRDRVGGLAGVNDTGTVRNSYSTGSVAGAVYVGGLIGYNDVGALSSGYNTAAITGDAYVGGLVGYNYAGSVDNGYSVGSVDGQAFIGGLVGANDQGSIDYSYSSGTVSGDLRVGGLVGHNGSGRVDHSYWNSETSGQATSAGGTGKTSAELRQLATFAGWDISANGGENSVWRLYEGQTAPLLRGFLTPLTVTAESGSRAYNGSTESDLGVTYSTTPNANLLGTAGVTAARAHVGSHATTVDGLYSHQQGYDIRQVGGTLDITPRVVSLNGARQYDGSIAFAGGDIAILDLVDGETLSLGGAGSVTDKNAGQGKSLSLDTLALVDGTGQASDYSLVGGTHTADIAARELTLTGSRVYDGSTDMRASVFGTAGTLAGVGAETVLLAGTGSVAGKDVRNGNQALNLGTLALANGTGLASNYSLTAGTVAITPATLTATATAYDKVYSGNTKAKATLTITGGLVGDETVTAVVRSARFDSKDVADAHRVTVTGLKLVDGGDGGLASNYKLAPRQTATAHITAKELTLAGSRVYDGSTEVQAGIFGTGGTLAGVGAETVVLGGTGTVASKNVRDGAQALNIGTLALADGTGRASNYRLAAGTVRITPAILTTTVTASDKVYSGNTKAKATLAITGGLVGDETITAKVLVARFDGKDATDTGRVTVTAAELIDSQGGDGGLASNYRMAPGLTATARITPKALTVTGMHALDKPYDGTTQASLSGGSLQGLVGGETLSFTGHSGAFADAAVGVDKSVTVSGIRLENGSGLASNYSLANPTGLRADITPAGSP